MWVLLMFLGTIACKQMRDTGEMSEKGTSAKSSKSGPGQSIPASMLPEPIAPGQARVQLKVVAVLPALAPAGSGPCSQKPCTATVRVERLLGYGSAFQGDLREGQTLQVSFPMTLGPTGGQPAVKKGDLLQAEVQGGLLGASGFTVQKYSFVK
jgi:hypothetical protein